ALCFFNAPATSEIYTLSLHDALPISIQPVVSSSASRACGLGGAGEASRVLSRPCARWNTCSSTRSKSSRAATTSSYTAACNDLRSEEHTSELQSRRDLVCRLLLEKKK